MAKMYFHNWLHFSGLNHTVFITKQQSSTPVNALNMINIAAIFVRKDHKKNCGWNGRHITHIPQFAFTILHEHLNMRRVCARCVLRLLMLEEKLMRVEVCQELQCLVAKHGEAYFNSFITSDERWLHYYKHNAVKYSLANTFIFDVKDGQKLFGWQENYGAILLRLLGMVY